MSREEIDRNGDNLLSMYEAHLYTLQSAVSIDLSRSTSEIYLEKWEPWYIRWLSWIPIGNDIYAEIARHLAAVNNLLEKKQFSINFLHEKRQQFQLQLESLKEEEKSAQDVIKNIQKEIQLGIRLKWPATQHPYTSNYNKLLRMNIQLLILFIKNHPKYPQLIQLQDQQKNRRQNILIIKRRVVQLDKMLRMRKLSRLLYFFDRYASRIEKSEYNRLLQCEQQPFYPVLRNSK